MSDEAMEYHVTWAVELEADSPEEAAAAALRIQRDPASIATVFYVKGPGDQKAVVIDLHEGLAPSPIIY